MNADNIAGEFDFASCIFPKGWSWDIEYLDTTVRLTASAVPLPSAMWLMASGLIGLFSIRRKREQ